MKEERNLIQLKNLVKTYDKGLKAVDGLDLAIEDNEICVLIGPSGCGKSTTLNMINRLIPITDGEVWINGTNSTDISPTKLRRDIGYAIQEVALFPHRTVAENIATVPSLKKWDKKKTNKRIDELLDLIGLKPEQYRDKYPIQLSGGESQRVGVARALGGDPPILLMDEPFGAIDPITRTRLQDEFLFIQEKIHKTIVFVTHDITEALKMGDKIAIMNEGKLVQYGTPREILQEPANIFVEEFMGTDRDMKWLQLVFAEELIEYPEFHCKSTDDYETVMNKFKDVPLNSMPVIDDNGKPIGSIRKRALKSNGAENWQARIREFSETIDIMTTVYDSLFSIFLSENNYLPILDSKDKFLGVLTQEKVNDLLNEIKAEGEDE